MRGTLNMLFMRTDRLGEVVLNLPTIAALRAAYPGARITMLADSGLEPLLRLAPEIDGVIRYEPGPRAAWWRRALRMGLAWRRAAYDVAIISNPMQELHLAAYVAGIPQRIGYRRKWGGLLTHRLPDQKCLGTRHEVEANMDLVRPLGIVAEPPRWQFPLLAAQQREALQLAQQAGLPVDAPFMVVHPWTSHPAKQWPLDRFRQLIAWLPERLGTAVVVIGGQAEAALIHRVIRPSPSIIDVVGRLTLPQLAGLLQRAEGLISNDSGPVHLAAAVGTRTLVIFGAATAATGPGRWGPWGSGHLVIWKSSPQLIQLDDVYAVLEAQWVERSKGQRPNAS